MAGFTVYRAKRYRRVRFPEIRGSTGAATDGGCPTQDKVLAVMQVNGVHRALTRLIKCGYWGAGCDE